MLPGVRHSEPRTVILYAKSGLTLTWFNLNKLTNNIISIFLENWRDHYHGLVYVLIYFSGETTKFVYYLSNHDAKGSW